MKGASILVQTILSSIRKDFRVEFRGRYAINVSVAFAFITTLSISFATGGTAIRPAIQAIFLWVILFFSAMNSLSHVFTREEEESTALFLRLHSSAETVFLSKLLYNMAVFMFLEILIVPLCVFFFSITVIQPLQFSITMLAGGIAITSATTIIAAIVSQSGGRGSLFTILSFPVTLPVLWVTIEATTRSITTGLVFSWNSVLFLAAFSMALLMVSYLLFPVIWDEG